MFFVCGLFRGSRLKDVVPNNEIVNKAAKLKKRLQKISSKYIYLVFRVSRQAGQVKKKNTF